MANIDNNNIIGQTNVQTDTILEDMISFKLEQEVTVNKIIFEDSDEEFPINDVEEVYPSPNETDLKPPFINNVIILGTKKVIREKQTDEIENEKSITETETGKEVVSIKSEDDIQTEKNNEFNIDTGTSTKTNINSKQQNTIETDVIEEEVTKRLGPNEFVSISMENIKEVRLEDENMDPLIISEPSVQNHNIEPKKCTRDFPHIKVVSIQDIKKLPSEPDTARRHTDDSNTSQSYKSSLPAFTTNISQNIESNNTKDSTNKNNPNATFNDPFVIPMLTTVAENLLVIFPRLYSYITARRTIPSKRDETYKSIKSEFEALKTHCFCLSYTTTLSIIVPNKNNSTFMKEFYKLTEKIAMERGTLQFSMSNLEILCREMIEFTEEKKKKMADLFTNPRDSKQTNSFCQNKQQNLELIKMLQASEKMLPKVSDTPNKDVSTSGSPRSYPASVIKNYQLKTGPPGREIEITYNAHQQPQVNLQNVINNHQADNSTFTSMPDISQPYNPINQPNSNNQDKNRHTIPAVASNALNNLSNKPANIDSRIYLNNDTNNTPNISRPNNLTNQKPNSNNQTYQSGHWTTADMSTVWRPNMAINNDMPNTVRNQTLNYMDTFNAYLGTLGKDSDREKQTSNTSNVTNTPKSVKRRRPSVKDRKSSLGASIASLPPWMANQNKQLQIGGNTVNSPSAACQPYSIPPPPYYNHQTQQYYQLYNNNQMPQTHHGYQNIQKVSPAQQYSSMINTPALPVQERSSVSRDSGFMSPLDESNLLDQLDLMVSAAAHTHNANVGQAQQMSVTPVITHVTSLDPTAPLAPYGNCFVCKRTTKFRCLGCNLSYYCRYECQQYDWPRHSMFCKGKQATN